MEKGNKIILVMGVLAIGAGIFVKYDATKFQEKAVETEGKVVHVIASSYHIQYFTADGTEHIYKGSGKNHKYREGNTVKAWYHSEKPQKVRFTDGIKTARTIILAGIVCILLGIYPLFTRKREKTV